MNIENKTENFVREFIASLRSSYEKTYKITWDDVKILFGSSVDPVVFDMDEIWGSTVEFEWLVWDICENTDCDFKDEEFVVHIAHCIFENGTTVLLSIGGGGDRLSRNAFLSFYNKEHRLRWMCQIVVEKEYQHKIFQAGTVQMRYNDERGEHITSMYMKSVDETIDEKLTGRHQVNEMVFNGNFEYPIYSPGRGSKLSYEGFEWDNELKSIWVGAFVETRKKDGNHINTFFTIDINFWGAFLSDIIGFDQEVLDTNPENKCSQERVIEI